MLPLKQGGFGLASAVMSAPAAYLAAVFNSIQHAPTFIRVKSNVEPLTSAMQLTHNIDSAISRLTDIQNKVSIDILGNASVTNPSSISDLMPASAAHFVEYYTNLRSSSIQSDLCQRTYTTISYALQGAAGIAGSVEEMARLKCLRAKYASRWLQVTPSEHELRLSNHYYRWAARLRLGLSVPTIQHPDTDTCRSCGKLKAFEQDRWHHLSCNKHVSVEGAARHHSVVDTLERHVRMVNGQSDKEPTNLAQHDRTRPDLQIHGPERDLLIDVSITHPACPSHRDAAAGQTLSAATKSAMKKNRKYADMTTHQQAEFFAFACETFGGMDKPAIKVIERVANMADDNLCSYSYATIKQSLLDSVAINIQRGNARIMCAASIQSRGARRHAR
jgi:hypothetical protein